MRWSKKLEAGSTDIEKFQPQHTILLENMDMDCDVNSKMSSHDVDDKDDDEALLKAQTTELVGEPDTQHTLVMAPQYLELERSEVDGHPTGTQVVKVNANGHLVSCEMIQHVGAIDGDQHGGLVVHVLPPSHHTDLKDGTTYYTPAATAQQLQRAGALLTEERFLTDQLTTQHYEDDLLGHDLTDDDRRLAAALMAVQYSQQQKQQQNIAKLLEPGGIVSEGNVIMSVSDTMQSLITTNQLGKVVTDPSQGSMSDMVVEYIQQVEGTSTDRKHMRLVAYHTDGQTIHTTDGAQLQAIDASQLQTHELKTISHTPAKKIVPSQMSPRARYKRSLEEGLGDMGTGVRESAESVIAQRSVGKNEDEEEEEEFDTEDDLNDSDYDVESGNRSSRRSLPHKKRIPRKLKNVKKATGQEKVFKCIKCDETFQTQNTLTAHKQLHKNNKLLFNCEICGKPSPNQLQFFEHLKSHYEPPKNIQTMDDVIIQDNCIKEEHLQSVSQVLLPALPPPLACTHCGKVFRRQKALEKHVSTAHGQVEEVLDEEMDEDDDMGDTTELLPEEMEDESLKKEGEWFTHHELTAVPVQHVIEQVDEHKLVEHVDGHHVLTEIAVSELQPVMEEITNDHLCDHCGENFELKSQLTLHMREEHPEAKRKTRAGKKESVVPESGTAATAATAGEKVNRKWEQLTCPTCGRMFNHRNSLVYHLRSHTGERPHQCEVCGKSFFAASALKVHMRLHSGDKPYKCELCGRHFRQWGDLKYHCISIHTDEKQYQCEYCGKDFARKYSLIVHRRIHTGEKNYKCEFCNKTFRASSYLQNHRRIHTGEKPHPCDVCGKPFRVRSDMKRHMQTHTREGGGSSNHHHHQTAAAAAHAAALSQSSQSSSQGATELPELDPVAAEITIQDGDRDEAAAASAALAQEQDGPQQITEVAGEEVQEEVLQQYSRDPLETVRDGTGSTLYVWPIYMA